MSDISERLTSMQTPRTDKAVWHTSHGVRVVDYEVACAMERLLALCLELLEEAEGNLPTDDLERDVAEVLELHRSQQA